MLALKLEQGPSMTQKSLKLGALSHYGWEPPTSMLATWVNRWSMGSIVGAKVLDPKFWSPG